MAAYTNPHKVISAVPHVSSVLGNGVVVDGDDLFYLNVCHCFRNAIQRLGKRVGFCLFFVFIFF